MNSYLQVLWSWVDFFYILTVQIHTSTWYSHFFFQHLFFLCSVFILNIFGKSWLNCLEESCYVHKYKVHSLLLFYAHVEELMDIWKMSMSSQVLRINLIVINKDCKFSPVEESMCVWHLKLFEGCIQGDCNLGSISWGYLNSTSTSAK